MRLVLSCAHSAFDSEPWISHHVHIRAVSQAYLPHIKLEYECAFVRKIAIPEIGKAILGEDEEARHGDQQGVGRFQIFGQPINIPISVDGLEYQFVHAVIHLAKALDVTDCGRDRESPSTDILCIELLRVWLIRDLVETYGDYTRLSEYSLFDVDAVARGAISSVAERQRLRTYLTRELSAAPTRGHLSGLFARKYCGGEMPRLMVPGISGDDYLPQVIRECLETLTWFVRKVRRPFTSWFDNEADCKAVREMRRRQLSSLPAFSH